MLFIRIWNYFIRCLWIRKRCFYLFFFRILFEQNKRKYSASSILTWRYLANRYKKWIGFMCIFIYFWASFNFEVCFATYASKQVRTFLSILKIFYAYFATEEVKNQEKNAINYCVYLQKWWPNPGSNWEHKDFQSFALPVELSGHYIKKWRTRRESNSRSPLWQSGMLTATPLVHLE